MIVVGLDLQDSSRQFPTTQIIRNMYKDMGHDATIDRGLGSYGD